jgi:hypothetical protein
MVGGRKPIPGTYGGHIGAKVGTKEHTEAHRGFREKLTEVKTDRGEFRFKDNNERK